VRFAATGHGDVKSLKDRPGELRLRVGKWRIFFCLEPPDLIRVLGIDNPWRSLLNALQLQTDSSITLGTCPASTNIAGDPPTLLAYWRHTGNDPIPQCGRRVSPQIHR
jgi:hypothetical protein